MCRGKSVDDVPGGQVFGQSQTVTSAGAATAVGVSLLSLTSMNKIWQMADMLQLYLLLLLLDTYMPKAVFQFITSNDLFNFSFDFGYDFLMKIPYVRKAVDYFNIDQDNSKLEYMDLDSGSSVINILTSTVIVLLIAIFHILIILP